MSRMARSGHYELRNGILGTAVRVVRSIGFLMDRDAGRLVLSFFPTPSHEQNARRSLVDPGSH